MLDVPFMKPSVPKLSTLAQELKEIEENNIYSNYGPINTRFENALIQDVFSGTGECMTVCNATIGLMLAMKYATRNHRARRVRYALMPSFTFAAAAHAAIWAGFTPLFCDIDPQDWSASRAAEEAMFQQYGSAIQLVVPYATFGNSIDLDYYDDLHRRTGAAIVIDAAASLGALDNDGKAFGTGFPHPVVYSMHATKTFCIGEGGLIYAADPEAIATMRAMGNFGFEQPRSASVLGLNSKLTEVSALVGLEFLKSFEKNAEHREALALAYRHELRDFNLQKPHGDRGSYQFMPVLLPDDLPISRAEVQARLKTMGIQTASYFSPHCMAQPFFMANGVAGSLRVTDHVASHVITLPLWSEMTIGMVQGVSQALIEVCASATRTPMPKLAPAITAAQETTPFPIVRSLTA